MHESLASVLSAVLLLIYWEVRARAARARQEALREEVRGIPEEAARQAVAAVDERDGAAS